MVQMSVWRKMRRIRIKMRKRKQQGITWKVDEDKKEEYDVEEMMEWWKKEEEEEEKEKEKKE